MFTGIIENIGVVTHIQKQDDVVHFTIKSTISHKLKIDQSVAHNGVCLTVVAQNNTEHTVTAVAETLSKSNMSNWEIGHSVNLERAMLLNERLDGHIVQGHVDGTGKCIDFVQSGENRTYTFEIPDDKAPLIIEKGSITINGTSLTIYDLTKRTFKVTIIPYTYEHTIFKYLNVGHIVNIEYDIIGKYLLRNRELNNMV